MTLNLDFVFDTDYPAEKDPDVDDYYDRGQYSKRIKMIKNLRKN